MEKEIYDYRNVGIRNIVASPEDYLDFPECQRDFVWSLPMQQRLIDSILRGLIVPPIIAVPKTTPLGLRYWVVDGQQRIRTVIRFGKGEFSTGSRSHWEPQLKPIEPGKTYREMGVYYRERFDNYPLQFCYFKREDGSVPDITACYRRLNYTVKLTPAERLYSFMSPTRERVMELCDHFFWREIYQGSRDRKQIFYMSAMLVELERNGGFCALGPGALTDMLTRDNGENGTRMGAIDGKIFKTISDNLTSAARMYGGAEIKSMVTVVPVYQSILLLKQGGFILDSGEEGCLTAWWNELRRRLIEEAKNSSTSGDAMGGLTKAEKQRRFWQANLAALEERAALVRKDTRRRFSELDKLVAWERQGGKCGVCAKKVSSYGVGHHVAPHSKGGQTSNENCMLVHKTCHP